MPRNFGGLIDRAHEAGLKVVVLGGKGDETVIEEVIQATSFKRSLQSASWISKD